MRNQSHSLRIAVIAGSTRPLRASKVIADWVASEDIPGVESVVVDLAEVDLPLLNEPHPAMTGRYEQPKTLEWSRLIDGFDGYVLVSPEYNHSTTAVLKNALDHLYMEWRDKPVGFVGYGVDGGRRAVEHLRAICGELGMAPLPGQVSLRLGSEVVGGELRPSDRAVRARSRLLHETVRWAGAFAGLRTRNDEEAQRDGRPLLDHPRWRPAAEAAARELTERLQAGLDAQDAHRYDACFGADVLWGSPRGQTLDSIEELLPIHLRLMARAAAPPSRFELVEVRAPAPGVAIAQIRRQALDGGFSEIALYVLVERIGRWWLAAAQNTPIAATETVAAPA